ASSASAVSGADATGGSVSWFSPVSPPNFSAATTNAATTTPPASKAVLDAAIVPSSTTRVVARGGGDPRPTRMYFRIRYAWCGPGRRQGGGSHPPWRGGTALGRVHPPG